MIKCGQLIFASKGSKEFSSTFVGRIFMVQEISADVDPYRAEYRIRIHDWNYPNEYYTITDKLLAEHFILIEPSHAIIKMVELLYGDAYL